MSRSFESTTFTETHLARNQCTMPNPRLTVVIPTYKDGSRLLDAVRSACRADKVIVVIDGVPLDHTVSEILTECPNTTLVQLPKNSGVTNARNVGFRLAETGLVLFLDADDELLPGAEERIKETCNKYSENIGVWLFANNLEQGKMLAQRTESTKAEALLINANRGERSVVVFRQDPQLVLPFIGSLRGHELAGLYRYCVRTGKSVVWSDKKVRVYNNTYGGLSSQRLTSERAKLIMTGHQIITKITFQRGFYALSIRYFLKSIKYRFVNSSHRIRDLWQ